MIKKSFVIVVSILISSNSQTMEHADTHAISYKHENNYIDGSDAILAMKKGLKIGLISYKNCSIKWLHVNQKYRNKGIGSELFLQCLETIKKKSNKAYWYAEESIDFFKRFGAKINDYSYVPGVSTNAFMEFDFSRDGNPQENLSNVLRKL